jgi:hypothetical protein
VQRVSRQKIGSQQQLSLIKSNSKHPTSPSRCRIGIWCWRRTPRKLCTSRVERAAKATFILHSSSGHASRHGNDPPAHDPQALAFGMPASNEQKSFGLQALQLKSRSAGQTVGQARPGCGQDQNEGAQQREKEFCDGVCGGRPNTATRFWRQFCMGPCNPSWSLPAPRGRLTLLSRATSFSDRVLALGDARMQQPC